MVYLRKISAALATLLIYVNISPSVYALPHENSTNYYSSLTLSLDCSTLHKRYEKLSKVFSLFLLLVGMSNEANERYDTAEMFYTLAQKVDPQNLHAKYMLESLLSGSRNNVIPAGKRKEMLNAYSSGVDMEWFCKMTQKQSDEFCNPKIVLKRYKQVLQIDPQNYAIKKALEEIENHPLTK